MVVGKSYVVEKREKDKVSDEINSIQHRMNFLRTYVKPLRKAKNAMNQNRVVRNNLVYLRKALVSEIDHLVSLQTEAKEEWSYHTDGNVRQPIPMMITHRRSQIRKIDADIEQSESEEEVLLQEIKLGEEELELRKREPEYKKADVASYLG